MDQQSVDPTESEANNPAAAAWDTMGGSEGDGVLGQQQSGPSPPPPPGGYAYGSPPPPASQQQQQQQPPLSGSGSITRFATPDLAAQQQQQQQQQPTSYTARSQLAYGGVSPSYAPMQAYGVQQQPSPAASQQQQSYASQQTAGSYAARSAQAYGGQTLATPSAGTGLYASRSAEAYGSQQQPTSQQQQQVAAPGSYAARSAQAYGTQQQPSTTAAAPQPLAGSSHAAHHQPTYGPPQQFSAPQQGSYAARSAQAYGVQTRQSPAAAQPGTSYAARSAQAYGTPQQQQQQPTPQQQQQQQQPTSAGSYVSQYAQAYEARPESAAGSYAARSTQTLYGRAQPVQQQQQPAGTGSYPQQEAAVTPATAATTTIPPASKPTGQLSPQAQAAQQRYLTDATRKVQEHAYYMRQAMEQQNFPVVLDRAAHMVGELGGPPHGHHHHHHHETTPYQEPGQPGFATTSTMTTGAVTNTGLSAKLTPKNYYELYMRALEDIPQFEEYLLNLVKQQQQQQRSVPNTIQIVDTLRPHEMQRTPYTMRELYDCVQYCPRVVSRLYLQISAGSALIRSGEVGARWVLTDLQNAVKCEQNPVRGLFLRHFLLTALRDKLPDTPPLAPRTVVNEAGEEVLDDDSVHDAVVNDQDPGTVKDSYEFVLSNFMEMNKLWVRIQHLPGEGKSKEVRKRRERERNDLRILVGTNLVRLSQLECVTSKIYGEIILQQILDHIVTTGDPLSQAYLMDCLVQVFPDEYHIETLPILLNVCPRLRDKVNIRTILQGLMDRLANYLAEEELLDESDTNQVKKTLARDSFSLFEECVQKVYNARGPKLTSREVIRLQTALLQFSIRCYPGNMEQVSRCISACVSALKQANASYEITVGVVQQPEEQVGKLGLKPLDDVSVAELEKLLSIPLDTLALKVLELEDYNGLISFLPWVNRREVAISMLKAVENVGSTPKSVMEINELFNVIEPLVRDEKAAQNVANLHGPTERATTLMAGLGVKSLPQPSSAAVNLSFGESSTRSETDSEQLKHTQVENSLVSKLINLLDHEDTDVVYEMLSVAREHISLGGRERLSQTLVAVVFASLRLARRVFDAEHGLTTGTDEAKGEKESAPDEPASGNGEQSTKQEEKLDEGDETDEQPETVAAADEERGDEGGEAQEQPAVADAEVCGESEEKESAEEGTGASAAADQENDAAAAAIAVDNAESGHQPTDANGKSVAKSVR
jgi:vacuolar protein sorting-associated protein 35